MRCGMKLKRETTEKDKKRDRERERARKGRKTDR